jgi:hypothetical protein
MDPDFDADAAIKALSEMAFTLAAVPAPARISEERG